MTAFTFPAVDPTDVSTQAVYTRETWAAGWSQITDLHCLRLALATGESLSSAEFHYRFGNVLTWGSSAFVARAVASVNPRSYMRVHIEGTNGRDDVEWIGIWKQAKKSLTRQSFSAVGVEALLDEPCRDLPFWTTTVRWAGRGLEFNKNGEGNRSAAKHTVNGQSVYTFGGTDTWSTRDAVEMLLAAGAPVDDTETVIFNWEPEGLTNLPDYDAVQLKTHGTSYLQLLRSLVTRYRLVGFRVYPEYDAPDWLMKVGFFTFAESEVSIKDLDDVELGTIPANANQDTYTISNDQSASADLMTSASHVVDQVIVTGDRRQIVYSVSKQDEYDAVLNRGTIDRTWTDSEVTDHQAAASAEPDYPTDRRDQDERDRDWRAADSQRHMFSQFATPDAWDQTAGDGEAGEALAAIAYESDDVTQFVLPKAEIEFLPRLPLLSGYTYADSTIGDNDGDAGHRGDSVTSGPYEPLPLLCFAKVVDSSIDPSAVDRWQQVDQLGRAADLEQADEGINRRWSASARPLRGKLAVEVRVQGEPQHALGFNEYSVHADLIAGAVDWRDLIFTVAIEDTREVESRYPADADLAPVGEFLTRLRIEAPGHKLIEVRPYTVVAVDPADLALVRSEGGLLQDDREQMKVIAQRAYAWHQTPRYSLGFKTGYIDGGIQIGRLVTAITDNSGTSPVNSIATELTYEFPISNSTKIPSPTMAVVTAFAELDPQRIV